MKIGRQSIRTYNNPAALLYGDNKVLQNGVLLYNVSRQQILVWCCTHGI